jgi:hypothetical protein
VQVTVGKTKVRLHLVGSGGLLMERWAVAKNRAWFENVYKREVEVD